MIIDCGVGIMLSPLQLYVDITGRSFMQRLRSIGLIAILTSALATVGLWSAELVYSESTAMIKVDGSSTVFPITEAVAEEFQKETRGAVRVTVGISGTGGGFKKFCRGEIDV